MLRLLKGGRLGLGNLRAPVGSDGLYIGAIGDGFASKTLVLVVLECAVIGESRCVRSAIDRL
jgi:hypothetical protein